MAILLRIALTPIAFALVSRAQTRFGDRIGGRLIGLPLTTGPFLLTVCLTESRAVAARAAAGVTSGQMAVVVFCCAYGCPAQRMRPLQGNGRVAVAGLRGGRRTQRGRGAVVGGNGRVARDRREPRVLALGG